MKSLLNRYFDELVIAAVIVIVVGAITAACLMVIVENDRKFKAACDRANGTTVFDGRQYQCIKDGKHDQ